MSFERNSGKMQELYGQCERLMNYHTIFTTADGNKFDCIIEGIEGDCVIVLVGEDVMEDEMGERSNMMNRQPRRFRRFRRRPVPFNNLAGVALLPYPYYVPPYPYPPYPPYPY